ncbi:MAG: hypothetical protein ACI3XA_06710 [Clostridia bacterium]
MLLILLGIGLILFSLFYLEESGLFRMGRTKAFEATVVDESEADVYDNIGGTKTRFFKVYEFFDGQENAVVKSERPQKYINNDVGRKCVIYVDTKNRKAMEKKDIIRYRLYALLLILGGFVIIGVALYIKNNVPGAVL